MANVQEAVNVRSEANENADRLGKLYKDCGGEILERENGWTKILSGELEGWIKDEYLLFGEEAQEYAKEVGYTLATINTDALRVRKEPSTEAGVYGLVKLGEELIVKYQDDDWIGINYQGKEGYISKEFATLEFMVNFGETNDEIKEREYIE